MRRSWLAGSGWVGLAILATASCVAAPDDPGLTEDTSSQEEALATFEECVNDAKQRRDTCYDDCARAEIEKFLKIAQTMVSAAYPCLGSVIGGAICADMTCNGNLDCMINCALDAVIGNLAEAGTWYVVNGKTFVAACGLSSAQLMAGIEMLSAEIATVAAFWMAGHAAGYMICTDSCTALFDAEYAGCEPILGNPKYCVCFDSSGCPTLAETGGSQTHITGTAECDSISSGTATDVTDGSTISCVSHKSMDQGSECAGDYGGDYGGGYDGGAYASSSSSSGAGDSGGTTSTSGGYGAAGSTSSGYGSSGTGAGGAGASGSTGSGSSGSGASSGSSSGSGADYGG